MRKRWKEKGKWERGKERRRGQSEKRGFLVRVVWATDKGGESDGIL